MHLKVGTFNLFQYIQPPYSYYIKKDKFTPEQFAQKQQWIKQQLKTMNCDIVGFQEVFSHESLEKLCQECGYTYYAKIDEPKHHEKNQNILVTTTVALASKYPIVKLSEVKLHVPVLKQHHFQGHFAFSRKPLKATIAITEQKSITIYVTHLKSNRLNEFEYVFNATHTLEQKRQTIQKALKQNLSPALKQRLCEASSIYHDIQKNKTPSILVCDLNDKEFSLTIDALSNGKYYNKAHTLLYDAYYLYQPKVYNPHPEFKGIKRTPTSYYLHHGNVLDYIFISNHFFKKAKVIQYEVLDAHLQKNRDGSLLQSDHAQVVCTLDCTTL